RRGLESLLLGPDRRSARTPGGSIVMNAPLTLRDRRVQYAILAVGVIALLVILFMFVLQGNSSPPPETMANLPPGGPGMPGATVGSGPPAGPVPGSIPGGPGMGPGGPVPGSIPGGPGMIGPGAAEGMPGAFGGAAPTTGQQANAKKK